MTYDMHGPWENPLFTGLHSALYKGSRDSSPFNIDDSVKVLESYGIDLSKVVIGIPTYGRRFVLESTEETGIGQPAKPHSIPTEAYRKICKNILSGDYKYFWDNEQKTPYIVGGNDWMGFDDIRSVTEKANYIVKNGLGGALFWSLEQDDHQNLCGQGKFPLMTTVSKIISYHCPSVCLIVIPKSIV
jgi:chitinase